MNVAIYARFSSSSQREASIEEQVKICKEYADRNQYVVVKVYSDSALTGKNDNRPALRRLLADSSKKLFEVVLVYSIDRFGRNLVQTLQNESKLNENGVTLLSATESFTNDPSGRFFRNLMMAHAQYYSDELSEKIKRGMDYNAEKCLCTGGNIALGYKVDKDKCFQIDPDTAPIVQKIFEMYASGKTVTEITTHLNAQGLKTARGVAFNKNSLHTMLKNKRYIGVYTYKGKEIPDGIPRIISDELFNKVAEIMEKNRKAPARSKAKVEYLLTTKLFCGHCKEMMTGFSATGKQHRVYNYYICNGKKAKKCDKKMVKKDYIEDLVVAQCRKLLTASNIDKIANEIVAVCEAKKDTSNLKYLKKLLSENERKHKNTVDAIMDCDIESVRKTLYGKLPTLESEHTEIERQIAQEEAVLSTVTVPKIKFFLTALKKGNANDIKYRKTLINIFINKIFLYDDRITITFNSGDEAVTINDILLSEIEENDNKAKDLFFTGDGPPCRDDGFDTMVSRLSSLLLCPKLIQIRDFHTLLRIAPPLTGVKFWSPAAFFCFWGPMNTLVNVILLWEIVNLLRNRYVVGQFQRIEEDFVKRLEVSLYYGCARGTRRFWINRIGGFHIVSMRSSRRFFCRSVRELHLAKRVRCSSVS